MKLRNKHYKLTQPMIPSAAEARQLSIDYYDDEQKTWNLIHNKLAKLITEEATKGNNMLILSRDNFFGWCNEDSLFYKLFTKDFIDMLTNEKHGFNYKIDRRDNNYYIIYW